MSDQFEIIHADEAFEVSLKIVRKTREFVVVKDYRNDTKEASRPSETEIEVESIRFTSPEKDEAITRAISHLRIIGDTSYGNQVDFS